MGQTRYKDQLKMMRAQTAASWVALVVERVLGAAKPAATSVVNDDERAARRWYGAFY
jgi:hypothetical protein